MTVDFALLMLVKMAVTIASATVFVFTPYLALHFVRRSLK